LRHWYWPTSRCASRQTAPELIGAAHSPIAPVIIIGSPKNWNWLRSRSCSSGSAGSFWFCRKFICSRTIVLPSRCSESHGLYIVYWSRFDSAWFGISGPGVGNSVSSRCAVTPTLAENAIASSVLRRLSSNVCRTRR
jgi:hypothetical protein